MASAPAMTRSIAPGVIFRTVSYTHLDVYKRQKSPIATTESGTVIDSTLLIFEKQLPPISFMDEENIIMALFAKLQGVNKIVAKVNEDSRAQMVEGLGIDSVSYTHLDVYKRQVVS